MYVANSFATHRAVMDCVEWTFDLMAKRAPRPRGTVFVAGLIVDQARVVVEV